MHSLQDIQDNRNAARKMLDVIPVLEILVVPFTPA